MLGEFLEKNCPDVSVQVVIKSNEHWGEYIDSVSTTHPLCDAKLFEIHSSLTFKICLGLPLVWFLPEIVPLYLHFGG